jgi:hypothetical protein
VLPLWKRCKSGMRPRMHHASCRKIGRVASQGITCVDGDARCCLQRAESANQRALSLAGVTRVLLSLTWGAAGAMCAVSQNHVQTC